MMKERKWVTTQRAEENLKLSHSGPTLRQASGQRIKILR